MAVMMPTSYNVVKCVEVLIMQQVDPNSKSLVTTIIYIIIVNY